jgi:hypothetical protein
LARLGFHSASVSLTERWKRNEDGNKIIALYLLGLGVPQQVIDLQPKADPCCVNYIDHTQAKAWGLLSDHPAKQQAPPTPDTQQPAVAAPNEIKEGSEPGSQRAADLAKTGSAICRCVNGQLLPSDCKGACLGSICLGLCKPHTPIAEQSRRQMEFPSDPKRKR